MGVGSSFFYTYSDLYITIILTYKSINLDSLYGKDDNDDDDSDIDNDEDEDHDDDNNNDDDDDDDYNYDDDDKGDNYVYDDDKDDKEEEMRDKVKIRSNLPFLSRGDNFC